MSQAILQYVNDKMIILTGKYGLILSFYSLRMFPYMQGAWIYGEERGYRGNHDVLLISNQIYESINFVGISDTDTVINTLSK